ncbi:hypothetical protein MNBD_GAMMA23-1755 [hydrothermal vent metagenome]|uniref:DUF4381 domain-containing protein n=1 Tax=hydrothermal vent metagenome TaxID=652676 RepID=A0A3B1A958_9ZZZZ
MNPALTPNLQNNSALRDIHLPDAVSWWPPAIGWWLLAGLIIITILLLPKLYRYIKSKPLNKLATEAYQKVINDYKKSPNNQQLLQALVKLLRQISMSYQGRDVSAHLTGDSWVKQLNALTERDYFDFDTQKLLTRAPYQKAAISNIDVQSLISTTKNWIAALPKNKQRPSRGQADD